MSKRDEDIISGVYVAMIVRAMENVYHLINGMDYDGALQALHNMILLLDEEIKHQSHIQIIYQDVLDLYSKQASIEGTGNDDTSKKRRNFLYSQASRVILPMAWDVFGAIHAAGYFKFEKRGTMVYTDFGKEAKKDGARPSRYMSSRTPGA